MLSGIVLLAEFILWTILIQRIDAQAAGPNGTEVGFAMLNLWFNQLTGVHMMIYTITDWLGLVPIVICLGFGILGVLVHKILEPSIKRKSDEKEILYISQERSGIKANGKPISEGFAVLKGSKVADSVATSLSKSVVDKQQVLFDKGIIDENFTFTQDWAFTSPSLASAIVVGCSINGRNAWKYKKGIVTTIFGGKQYHMNEYIIQGIGFFGVLLFIISYQIRSNRALFCVN